MVARTLPQRSSAVVFIFGGGVVGPEDDGEDDEDDGEQPPTDLVHVGRLLQVIPEAADHRLRLQFARL